MSSPLQTAFPTLNMHRICPACMGASDRKCGRCGMNRKDYIKEGWQNEVEEMRYLRETWEKCKRFKQITTGIKKLDNVLTLLWGAPHNQGWRDYKHTKPVSDSPFVCLRIARAS